MPNKDQQIDILEMFVKLGPMINQLFPEDIAVYVSNTEEMLAAYPTERIDFGVKAGDRLGDSWVITRAIKRGQRIVVEEDESNFGMPYISIANPIRDEQGKIVGGVTFNKAVDKKKKLVDMSDNLLEATEILRENIEEITFKSDDIVKMGQNLTEIADQTATRVDNTDNIVKLISDIAGKIKIIGINASIEAARVGAEGDGFKVVAEEIQNLASRTSDSITKIEKTLEQVAEITGDLKEVATTIDKDSKDQAEIAENINAQIQNLNSLGEEILEFAKLLSENKTL